MLTRVIPSTIIPTWRACVLASPDLFAILKCTEKLERAYVRDGVTAKDYEAQCEKLIAQFRMLWGSMKETVRPGVETTAAAGMQVLGAAWRGLSFSSSSSSRRRLIALRVYLVAWKLMFQTIVQQLQQSAA
jgi:hypothetical protein